MKNRIGGLGIRYAILSVMAVIVLVPLVASLIVIAPIVLVYLIFQRNFVSGLTQGAIK